MIQVQNLSKSYGNINALNNLNFTIKKGEIFGLLGPNGAGKSTTIKILSALLSSYTGTVLVDNISLSNNVLACKKMIGVVPQEI
ncbi:MAG: ATP-binding cassette domain-containing protein, partial [Lutibacter sp.]|nr:ATP-binding cassette domain-containing protein [Lutibacter sp.]